MEISQCLMVKRSVSFRHVWRMIHVFDDQLSRIYVDETAQHGNARNASSVQNPFDSSFHNALDFNKQQLFGFSIRNAIQVSVRFSFSPPSIDGIDDGDRTCRI